MKDFMDENFILTNKTAKALFDSTGSLPIIDYHCHLNPAQISEDKHFRNISEAWLAGDHYKWRAMRSFGIDEKFITGNADDKDKFRAWAKVVPYLIGNPLLHWTYLELRRYFGINEIICEKNADYIWDKANERISSPEFSARGLIRRSNVELICTTDDPYDDLRYHKSMANDKTMTAKVLPAFRPDKVINIDLPSFMPYLEKIKSIEGKLPSGIEELKKMLLGRLDFFEKAGCKVSDHGLEIVPSAASFRFTSDEAADKVYRKALRGEALTEAEVDCWKACLLLFFGREYAKRGWVMQLHMSALRNNNTFMFNKVGVDAGFDSINDREIAAHISCFLDMLAKDELLPKTILYSLNPKDNYVLGAMIGNFQTGGEISKMQFGSAWWFNDNKDGMEEQMKTLANLGALSKFVGMLTDSRSFLSYTRHEYFRRIMCNILGTWAENGEYPYDMDMLEQIAGDISYYNIKKYIGEMK